MEETYETIAKGMRILPGQWRPHHPWEQIAWVSPNWPSQDYVWLDFPEAIFSDAGLLYLSHVNPACPTVFADLPPVAWDARPEGISFQRELPNGVRFGGSVTRGDPAGAAELELFLENGTDRPLREIKLQTCACLRGIKEFADPTEANKLVHLPGDGWRPFADVKDCGREDGRFRFGWRGGPASADLPVMATVSNRAERLAAITWYDATYSLISNPLHPCMHADPAMDDLAPGQRETIRGSLIFFEGTPDEFGDWFTKRWSASRALSHSPEQ